MATGSTRSFLVLILLAKCLLLEAASHSQEYKPKFMRQRLGDDDFVINIVTNGTYSIAIKGETWLRNAPTFVNMYNSTHTAEGGSLKLKETDGRTGHDNIGDYQSTSFVYEVTGPSGPINFTAEIKSYTELPVIIFYQTYDGGCTWCQADSVNGITAGFPGFKVDGPPGKLGLLSFGGQTINYIGQWFNGTPYISDGIAGGPLALFDAEGRTLVISPFDNFMSASFSYDKGNLYGGVMGGVSHIPAGYPQSFIMYYGTGINKAFDGWGGVLRRFYQKNPIWQQVDMTLSHLGYWTDRGGYYYYNTESGQTYEATMVDIKAYADAVAIPYRYFQYDSWWYYKGKNGGVKTWEARPDIFPDGFSFTTNKTGLPAGAHNRYWDADTTYAKQNGGLYDFIVENKMALPLKQDFWADLFANATEWGLILYEQDWLYKELIGIDALLHDLFLGSTWLNEMGFAAYKKRIFIQYCQPTFRHIMQALIIPSVTQARASVDYSPGGDQWDIGITSIVAEAMGVAPFKDTFWTTENQTGNPYGRSEPYWKLNMVVAVLSTGPVGPSDKIGHTNVDMLMRCCNTDGLILKPGHPARAIDGQILKSAFPEAIGPTGEAWVAWSEVSVFRFANFLLLNLETGSNYTLYPKDLGDVFINITDGMLYAVKYDEWNWTKFTSTKGITFTDEYTRTNFALYHIGVGIYDWLDTALVGDMDRWVPMSPQRVFHITWNDDKITAELRGARFEEFYFGYILHGFMNAQRCMLNFQGEATFTILANETVTCL